MAAPEPTSSGRSAETVAGERALEVSPRVDAGKARYRRDTGAACARYGVAATS
jgi:hypothetical protein